MSRCITYGVGYRYQTRAVYRAMVEILPPRPIVTPWIWLSTEGEMSISMGYAWDGASRCPDFRWIVRPSLYHDAAYQLMREGHLDPKVYRKYADNMFYRMCLEDGAPPPDASLAQRLLAASVPPLAWLAYQAVRLFANPATDPARREPDRMAGQCAAEGP